ncbi:hypothetical protein BE04_20775 [Sorangium cellulosum]|uniref:Uncharacterized protein n=1 Tax=Sorangium cellulosum TaxID=56 RepID=A0A150P4X0_SORCE|nr:hypothetical protein BE04_20775 [Sorangium cellulosum]
MAHNFHDINGWLIVGLEMHQGFHIFPPAPMKFLKLVLLHPFTLGDKQKPTVLFNGVPSVAHQHEPKFLWPHLGIIPDPLDALTPLHILFGSHKCWLPRGAVEICGEKATCCVIGGPVSLNADCWDIGRWPTSLVLNPGTVQTTPTFGDFAMGAVTLAIDLVLDLLFEGAAKIAGGLLLKFGGKVLKPLFKKGKDLVGKGLRAATKQMGKAGKALGKGARALKGKAASALKNAKCRMGLEPVDLTSGRVLDSEVDLSLPGVIPLVWERHYSSASALERTSMGRGGWTHRLEQWIEQDEGGTTLRDEEGRDIYFPALRPGEHTFQRPDRLTLRALNDGRYSVYSHETRLTRLFAPDAPGARAVLRAIQDAWGNSITLEYTGSRLHRVVDTAGREMRVKSTHGGRIARLEVWVDGRLEQWVDYSYTKMGELARAADALGHDQRYEYDEEHRLIKKTLKNGVNFYYEYDPDTGWCRRSWGDGGLHRGEIKVDLEQRITWLIGNDEPRVLHWNEDGLVVREETPDGTVLAAREYDRDQYLVSEAAGGVARTRYEYDEQGNKIRQVDPAGNTTEWTYEDDLPLLRVKADGSSTHYTHDALGALVAVTEGSGQRYALEYDDLGRLRAVRSDGLTLSTFEMDARHNLVEESDARGARTRYRYDPLGRPVARIDALGRGTHVFYDLLGRTVMAQRPDGTTSRAEYDPLGNPVRTINALGEVTEMAYGGTGVPTRLRNPDGSGWEFHYTPGEKLRSITNPRGEAYEYTYDAAGNIATEKTFDGRVLEYQYSPAGHLARVDYPDGSFRAFTRDVLGNVVREDSTDGPIMYRRDRMGRMLGAVLHQDGREVRTSFERDREGRVVAEAQDGRRIEYDHDAQGRRTRRVMPDGTTTRYAWDALDNLVGVEHAGRTIAIDRDVLGRERRRGDREGRFSIHCEYDAMDRLIGQQVTTPSPSAGPHVAVQRVWQYDALGRTRTIDDRLWGTTRYQYDSISQLIEAQRGSTIDVFDYDIACALSGMRAHAGAPAPEETGDAWEIAPGDRLVRTEKAAYAYDRRGRRVRRSSRGANGEPDAVTEYTWDCRDRLREVKLTSGTKLLFTYDAFGRRMRKEVVGATAEGLAEPRITEFLWDGDALAADIDDVRGARCFVHEPETLEPLLQSEGQEVFSYVNDHLGTPRELVDSRGRIAWSARHTAWGALEAVYRDPSRAAEASRHVSSPFRLLGQYADEETGLCYTRFRYFDAEVGRWCTPDPLGIDGGEDLYAFDGNPANDVDPLGLACPSRPPFFTNKSHHHIQARHVSKTNFPNKTKWKGGKYEKPANKTLRNPDRVTPQDGGRIVYEKDFGRTTGYEFNPATGKHDLPVSKVRVVVEPNGEIVTAFPQRDWK